MRSLLFLGVFLAVALIYQNCSKGFRASNDLLEEGHLSQNCPPPGSNKLFGADDRFDISESENDPVRVRLAELSVGKVNSLAPVSGSTLNELALFYSKSIYPPNGLPLCPDVKFQNQKVFAGCSGSYIGNHPDTGNAMILTNSHCVNQCSSTYFIFDARINQAGTEAVLNRSKILTCKTIHFSEKRLYETENGRSILQDIAILEMNAPAPLNLKGKSRYFSSIRSPFTGSVVPKGQALIMVGYPFGLPMKGAINGNSMDVSQFGYFNHSLDHLPGNSGSPILDPASFEIIGVFQGTAARPSAVESSFQQRAGSSPACLETIPCDPVTGCHSYDGRPAGGVAIDLVFALNRALNEGRISRGLIETLLKTKPTPEPPVPTTTTTTMRTQAPMTTSTTTTLQPSDPCKN